MISHPFHKLLLIFAIIIVESDSILWFVKNNETEMLNRFNMDILLVLLDSFGMFLMNSTLLKD